MCSPDQGAYTSEQDGSADTALHSMFLTGQLEAAAHSVCKCLSLPRHLILFFESASWAKCLIFKQVWA